MKDFMRWATALYPARWRARYGREFDALLEDMDPGWRDVWNVVNGGLVMQIQSIGVIPIGLVVAGTILGGAVTVEKRELYRSSAVVTLKAADPRSVTKMLGATFGPDTRPITDVERAAWIRIAIDERGPAPADGATRLVLASEDPDAAKAQRITGQLVDLVARTAAAQTAPLLFTTINPPNLPTTPSGPSRATLALFSVAAGLLLGAVAMWFRRPSSDQRMSA